MKRVLTYGTFDLLHIGHIKLLERAKALGDYLIVGVTADAFDKARGKINVVQSLAERIEAVKNTKLADEIIVEEYEGQKIDDVQRYDIDVFTVGDDWVGKFDYLKEFCEVVYLPRTAGISSSEIRSERNSIRLCLVGSQEQTQKVMSESEFVNGLEVSAICDDMDTFDEMKDSFDAVYIYSHPTKHYDFIKHALLMGKHVLCEPPVCIDLKQFSELQQIAKEHGLVLMDSLKTAYSTAYNRLMLLIKTGVIGKVISIDSVCTSLADLMNGSSPMSLKGKWNSICAWGPTAMLPVFQLFGTKFKSKSICTDLIDTDFDAFTNITFVYDKGVATVKVGKGYKSEGHLVISGTKGYIYVPSPWWKTDYFEVRYENQSENKRYFYPLEGEGIRYELVSFVKSIEKKSTSQYVKLDVSETIVGVIEDFYSRKDTTIL